MQYMARGLTSGREEISQSARISFYRATGICPDAQEAIEEAFRSMGRVPDKANETIQDVKTSCKLYNEVFSGDLPTWEESTEAE
jgi:hypothetical protein